MSEKIWSGTKNHKQTNKNLPVKSAFVLSNVLFRICRIENCLGLGRLKRINIKCVEMVSELNNLNQVNNVKDFKITI